MSEEETHPSSPARRKRRWYQCSLRTLLIFMVLAAMGLSWYAVQMRQARRDRMLVEMLRRSGYWVVYPENNHTPDPPGPLWLRALLGDYVSGEGPWEIMTPDGDRGRDRITSVRLINSRLTEAEVDCLKMLPSLQVVDLSESTTTVTNEAVKRLQEALPDCTIRR